MPLPCGSTSSREWLEILDDERRVLSFRVVGGEHCLANYRSSVTTVHEAAPGHTLVGTKTERRRATVKRYLHDGAAS